MYLGQQARRSYPGGHIARRPSGLLLVAALVITLLAGCGQEPRPTGTGTASGGTSGSSATAGSGGNDAEVVIWADPTWVPAIRAMADLYSAAHDVVVAVQPMPADEIRAAVTEQAPQGQGPDLFVGANEWTGELVAAGLVSEVDLGEKEAGFTRLSLDSFRLEGRIYGVPFDGENLALLRNEELAPKAPKSIEAMARTGSKLKAAGKVDLPIGLPIGPTGDAHAWYPFYSAAAGYIYAQQPDGGYEQADLGIGMPGSVQAGIRLAELAADGAIDPKVGAVAAAAAFAAGRTPYLIAGPQVVSAARDAGIKVAIDPVPGFADTPEAAAQAFVGFQGFMLSAFARDKAAALDLIRNGISTTALMDALYTAHPAQPGWQESLSRAMADPTVAAFAKFGEASAPLPNLAQMEVAWSELDRAEVAVLSGTRPAKAMAQARRAVLADSQKDG